MSRWCVLEWSTLFKHDTFTPSEICQYVILTEIVQVIVYILAVHAKMMVSEGPRGNIS